jgi:hypothetical protein
MQKGQPMSTEQNVPHPHNTLSAEARAHLEAQLERLPRHSVILDAREHAWQKDGRGSWWDGLSGMTAANSYLAQRGPFKTLYVGGSGR